MNRLNGSSPERRRHPRLPVVEGLVEPITLSMQAANPKGGKAGKASNQPAILTNLSAGGMSLIMFAEPPHIKVIDLDLTLPGLPHVSIQAKVVRVHMKGETYNIGLQFTKIQKKHQKQICGWAEDHMDCETRISLNLPEVCVPTCRFHCLCQKTQKAPHWPRKA